MGISGLLKTLEAAQEPVHLEDFRGLRCAVDGYVWLHKGMYAAATDLALGRPTDKHIQYCMRKIAQLQSHGILVIIVLDGAPLPAKSGEEADRKEKREIGQKRAAELFAAGEAAKAHALWAQSLEVSAEIAGNFIEELKKAEIEFVVAPYEADAQLAFFSKTKKVDFCISEDSDLLAFGCDRVFFKLDKFGGGMEIRRQNLFDLDCLRGVDEAGFLLFCILSGCDYLPNIPGVGSKKALSFVRASSSPTIEAVLRIARLDGHHVPREYYGAVEEARLTFLHQTIYDPDRGCVRPLTPLGVGVKHLPSFGALYEAATAVRLANGDSQGVVQKENKPTGDGWISKKPKLVVTELTAYLAGLANKKPYAF